MRRAALLIVALAIAAAPSAAAPGATPKLGKPIRALVRAPAQGNASLVHVELKLVPKGKRSAAALPKVGVLVKAAGKVGRDLFIVRGVKRSGNTVRVAATFVVPHVLDTPGSFPAAPFAFDTQVFTAYTGGVAGPPSPATPGIDIFLFDAASGQPLVNADGSACRTCSIGIALRKQAIVIDNVLTTPHRSPPGRVVLGFSAFGAGAGDVNAFAFVTNAHTTPFDLSVFGFAPEDVKAPGDGGSAGTIVGAALDNARNRSTRRARLLRKATRRLVQLPPEPPPTPDIFLDLNHNHGSGTSNLCGQIRTSPVLPGAPGNAQLAGPSGAGTRTFTTGPDGRAVVVFPISQFGSYTMDVTVRDKTTRATYTVGGAPGSSLFSCPAP